MLSVTGNHDSAGDQYKSAVGQIHYADVRLNAGLLPSFYGGRTDISENAHKDKGKAAGV